MQILKIAAILIPHLACAVSGTIVAAHGPSTESENCGLFDFASVWARGVIKVYQTQITDIDGHSCPMAPSCSHFAEEALKKNGWWMGLMQTVDRLNRCNHDMQYYSLSTWNGKRGFQDLP